jgi:hypothetical protein
MNLEPDGSRKGTGMPTISMFFGIVIYMYFYDNERHQLPHVHAKYQGQDATFSIADGALIAGEIPAAKAKLVQAWIEIHREELMADWDLAINGEPLFRIDPLR